MIRDNSKCELCPRKCGSDRLHGRGLCGAGAGVKLARAALHHWEEPCFSGARGAGTVFFSGCPLGCVYCQNYALSRGEAGVEVSPERLCDIYFELAEKGAHNIDLVTPDCYVDEVVYSIELARSRGFPLPFICNCSGYETLEMINAMKDSIDVWMPDYKYHFSASAEKYSRAPDYPEVARRAIDLMTALRPECEFDAYGMMTRGVLIRHLLLPGNLDDSRAALDYLYGRYGNSVWYSIMNQYTTRPGVPFPELSRKVTRREYDALVDHACGIGIENAFIQEGDAALESFIPPFDCEGVIG